MNPNSSAGVGSVYASGIWLARVHYTVPDGRHQMIVRVCDGERDLMSPPIPAHDMHIELDDGSRRPFLLFDGNPATGMYYIYQ